MSSSLPLLRRWMLVVGCSMFAAALSIAAAPKLLPVVKTATAAEAAAGTVDNRVITPETLKATIAATNVQTLVDLRLVAFVPDLINEAALTADLTLTTTLPTSGGVVDAASRPIQVLTPNADGWIVTLPADDPWGIRPIFNASSTYSLDVYTYSSGTPALFLTLAPNGSFAPIQPASLAAAGNWML